MSVIKDPIMAPYEIQVEEDQYVLIDTDKDKPLGYYSSLDSAIKALLYLMDNISSNRKNELEKKLVKLLDKFAGNDVIKDIIEEKLGYSYDN